jgi:hypothetical protein
VNSRGRRQKGNKPKQPTRARQREQERARAKAARAQAGQRERYEKRLETRLDRLEAVGRPLIDFFAPLGISVDLTVRMTDDLYVVDGKSFGSAGGSQKDWNPEIDRFVAQQHHLAQRFVASITENAAPLWPGARAYYVPSDHGFTLAWPDAEVGFVLVCPTHARVFFDGPLLAANYLVPGRHWGELKDAIEAHELERRSTLTQDLVRAPGRAFSHQPVRVPLRVLGAVPLGTPRQLERAVLDASRRLRLERQMVYATPAVLEADFGRIRFEPIESEAGHLLVPFRLRRDSDEVEGGLSLSGERDPLRIEIYRDAIEDDPFVWSTAIRGYADLTTWNLIDAARQVAPAGRHRGSTEPRADGARAASRAPAIAGRRPRRPSRGRQASWPAHLRPLVGLC